MGNLITGPQKTTPTTTPVTQAEPLKSSIPQSDTIKPSGKTVSETTTEVKAREKDELRVDKVKPYEDTPTPDSEPPLTLEKQEAVLRYSLKEKKHKYTEYTRDDFGITDKCKKKKEKIDDSDSDDEQPPISQTCKKQGRDPCKEKLLQLDKAIDEEQFKPIKEENKLKVETKSKPKPKVETKPKVQPPCPKYPTPTSDTLKPPSTTKAKPTATADFGTVGSSCRDTKKGGLIKDFKDPVGLKGIGMGQGGGRMAGDYPLEYNAKVHGPYDPARYYGKPDTPFGQVKLGELVQWIGRRNKSPQALVAAISRAHWRWQHKYMLARKSTMAPFIQFVTVLMIGSYSLNRFKIQHHYHFKYH